MPDPHSTEARSPRSGDLIIPASQKKSGTQRRRKRSDSAPPPARLRAYLALITLVLLVFSPILGSDLLWSEYDSVERSRYESMESWQQAWSISNIRQNDPISITSYFLEAALPLPTAPLHRGINILLHLLAAILLLKNLEALKLSAAFSATLAFALHPAILQTLFWSGYRTEIIGLVLILSALYFGTRNRSTADYVATILFTTLACLVHPAALAIPVILALIILYQERIIHIHSFNRVLPLICLCLFLGVWANAGAPGSGPINELSATDRLNQAGQNMSFFTRQALLPLSPGLFHEFKQGATYQTGAQMSLLPFLLFLPFFVLIAFNIRKHWSRAILLGLGGYLLLVIYGTSQNGHFINGSPAHEDHGLYIALPLILALIITGLGRLIYNIGPGGKPVWALGFSVLLLIEMTLTGSFAYSIAEPNRMWQLMSERWPDAWQPKAALVDNMQQAEGPSLTNIELIKHLEFILKQRPELVDKRILLARTFITEGQNTNAVREYKRVLRDAKPGNDFLKEAARFFDKVGLKWDADKARQRMQPE
jgi:hypothetical protein